MEAKGITNITFVLFEMYEILRNWSVRCTQGLRSQKTLDFVEQIFFYTRNIKSFKIELRCI